MTTRDSSASCSLLAELLLLLEQLGRVYHVAGRHVGQHGGHGNARLLGAQRFQSIVKYVTLPRGELERTDRRNEQPPPQGATDDGPGGLASDLAAFVEDLGLMLEAGGIPRAAGRLTAWLLVCDPPEQSADDLSRALGLSSGGVSMNVRFLTRNKLVERVGKAGDRRRYYRIAPQAWSALMVGREAEVHQGRLFGEKGLALLADETPARRERLIEMTDCFAFLEREMPLLMRRFHDEKGLNHG